MASGDDGARPKDVAVTRSATGKSKPVDYRQLMQGKYQEAKWRGDEFDSGRSDQDSDTGLYQDRHDVIPEVDAFGISRETPSLPRGDLDFQLAAEHEELEILKRQLDAAKKEEELLKKRNEADSLRRQIAAQQSTNAKLRGMPNDGSNNEKHLKSKNKPKKSSIPQTDNLSDNDITLNHLRKSKKLRKLVKKDLKKLGLDSMSDNSVNSDTDSKSGSAGVLSKSSKKLSTVAAQKSSDTDTSISFDSSDSSSSSSSDKKKKKKKKDIKEKSGIRAKASDTVRFPQKYLQAYLKYEFTSSNLSFQSLEMNLFCAGELEIIGNAKIKEVERSGRINLLKKIMYLNTSYDFKTLKSYYAACLNEIEIGHKTWKVDFQHIESAILSKHVPKQSLFPKKQQFKTKEDSGNKKSEEKMWFCALYNRNKCPQKSSHTETKFGRLRFAHHVCATCWQKDGKKLEHPECSTACPYSKN